MGGGCFWCTEAVFQQVPAVLKVRQFPPSHPLCEMMIPSGCAYMLAKYIPTRECMHAFAELERLRSPMQYVCVDMYAFEYVQMCMRTCMNGCVTGHCRSFDSKQTSQILEDTFPYIFAQ
jgi:hypothetical protein